MKETLSVKEYAERVGLTRFGVNYQIRNKCLPDGVKAKKIGRSYILTITKP